MRCGCVMSETKFAIRGVRPTSHLPVDGTASTLRLYTFTADTTKLQVSTLVQSPVLDYPVSRPAGSFGARCTTLVKYMFCCMSMYAAMTPLRTRGS